MTMRWLTSRTRATCAASAKGGRDGGVVGAAEPVPVERDIAGRLGPDLRRLRQRGGGDIGDGIARLVIDRDELGAVARYRLALGDDERHGLPGMPDAVAGQRRTMGHDEPGAVRDRGGEAHVADAVSGHVGGGQDRQYARKRQRRARVDAADRGEGVRRADEDGMRLARGAVVVAETPGAGQQAAILVARLERQAHPGSPSA